MQKKYRHTSLLFIGLLSFQTFVSCAHTRQLVGLIGGNEAGKSIDSDYQYHVMENGSEDDHASKPTCRGDSVILVLGLLLIYLCLAVGVSLDPNRVQVKNNSSMEATSGLYPLNGSMLATPRPSNSSVDKDRLDEFASTLKSATSEFGK